MKCLKCNGLVVVQNVILIDGMSCEHDMEAKCANCGKITYATPPAVYRDPVHRAKRISNSKLMLEVRK